MLTSVVSWVELHPVTVEVALFAMAVAFAWFAGLFKLVRSYTRQSKLHLVKEASLVFLEDVVDEKEKRTCIRAAFILHAAVTNRTAEKIVVDTFGMSYRAVNRWLRFRRNLLRVAFPSRPRKSVGKGIKPLGVWFTQFLGEDLGIKEVTGVIEPKEYAAGYLLFVSYTWGDWNPLVESGRLKVWLRCHLTTGECLRSSALIRIERDRKYVEEMVPGLSEHIAHESTWNHDVPYKR